MDFSNKKKYANDMQNVKQWLHSTKTRCDSLKSHMEYMKTLYNDIPKLKDTKEALEDPNWYNSKDGTPRPEPLVPDILNFSSDVCMEYKDEEEEATLNDRKPMGIELSSITSRTYNFPPKEPASPSTKVNTVCEKLNHNWQHPCQGHLTQCTTEVTHNSELSKKPFKPLILDAENEYLLQALSSARNNTKLNTSDSVKDISTGRSRDSTKTQQKEKPVSTMLSGKNGSTCKVDDLASLKCKKRRRRIHASNSKSTVTTRDTSFVGRKDTKKRKQKNNISYRGRLKSQQSSNEVVEIYHNTAAKSGSTSAIPSKHSKVMQRPNYINISSAGSMNKHQNIGTKRKREDTSYQTPEAIEVPKERSSPNEQHPSQPKSDGKNTTNDNANYIVGVPNTPTCAIEKCDTHHCQHTVVQASYCGPMVTHNYELPTLASKLKRANRSYLSRFSFRNIPFVVGTSVSPSHNLGLNIQQVLSIMKTKQSAVNRITPLLIRKLSRGMGPATILMEQMSAQQSTVSHLNTLNGPRMEEGDVFIDNTEHSVGNNNARLEYPRKTNTKSENRLNTLDAGQILHTADQKMIKLFTSQQDLNTRMKIPTVQPNLFQESICENHVCQSLSTNRSRDSKGIRDVLINLHDQFEEMNTKYERLQAKAKDCADKDVKEEILDLEKDLNIKEDEINAVVSLYKEVMMLKEQMRQLQDKKSYVCISTEIPLASNKFYSTVPLSSHKSYGAPLQQRLQNGRGGNNCITTKEPTSLRLTGLLRQIQTFQRQLKLTSW